ncbi:pyruvate dehydrogenase complex, dehydrogenase (E1) component [Microbacterium testaceum StLB037]|uniref:Pyruvate dehydrogenase complex, dehydrogenase (E1) component n=1 Tax=Microbacterium testaceum (strain StLB037) TaxID=979556 RepID=E8ND36_MICTS|nr:pyruvate dehydrogenase complex, dehydrogenase (E1) component [Microbacterium testaceum StLB037]
MSSPDPLALSDRHREQQVGPGDLAEHQDRGVGEAVGLGILDRRSERRADRPLRGRVPVLDERDRTTFGAPAARAAATKRGRALTPISATTVAESSRRAARVASLGDS